MIRHARRYWMRSGAATRRLAIFTGHPRCPARAVSDEGLRQERCGWTTSSAVFSTSRTSRDIEDESREGSRMLELLRGHAVARPLEPRVELYTVPTLSAALTRLASREIDALLLDLSLPICHPLDALRKVRVRAPEFLVIVLGTAKDEAVITRAPHGGALDYPLRGELTVALVKRTLRAALEQHRLQTMLSKLTLRDELTGLLTRHGFFIYAEHQL